MMATWNDLEMYGYKPGTKGLKTCPFDKRHQMKPSKYAQHVLKCERKLQNPNSISPLPTVKFECLSIASLVSEMTTSSQMSTTSEDSKLLDERFSPVDSGIDCNTPSIAESNEAETESHQIITALTSVDPQKQPSVPIVPQEASLTSDTPKEENGSGDNDEDWNRCDAPHIDVYGGFDGYEQLTDEQIAELAEGFIDVVFITKLKPAKKKELYNKLINIRKLEVHRREKAFREIIVRNGIHDQIKDIPQEIRKPRVDIREIFKLKIEDKIPTLEKQTVIKDETNGPVADAPLAEDSKSVETQTNTNVEQPVATTAASVKDETVSEVDAKPTLVNEVNVPLNACCNRCSTSLALNQQNTRKMTVFCSSCSGVKFGGYFECQSCNMFGYFANNQIEQHLSKHFAK